MSKFTKTPNVLDSTKHDVYYMNVHMGTIEGDSKQGYTVTTITGKSAMSMTEAMAFKNIVALYYSKPVRSKVKVAVEL